MRGELYAKSSRVNQVNKTTEQNQTVKHKLCVDVEKLSVKQKSLLNSVHGLKKNKEDKEQGNFRVARFNHQSELLPVKLHRE